MRPTRRGALWEFPGEQPDRRVPALLRAGRAVTLVAQTGESDGRIEERRSARRWCPVKRSAPSIAGWAPQ